MTGNERRPATSRRRRQASLVRRRRAPRSRLGPASGRCVLPTARRRSSRRRRRWRWGSSRRGRRYTAPAPRTGRSAADSVARRRTPGVVQREDIVGKYTFVEKDARARIHSRRGQRELTQAPLAPTQRLQLTWRDRQRPIPAAHCESTAAVAYRLSRYSVTSSCE